MKIGQSLIVVGALCGALSLPALGEVAAKPMTTAEGKPMQLAYTNCWWHNGHRVCRGGYNRGYYHHRCHRYCWTGYYGRVHCRCR